LKGMKNQNKRILLGGGTTFLFLGTIEIFDGFSKEWGFSWGDMIANSSGIGIFAIQEMVFNKQIIRLKYSYHDTKYRDTRPDLLGENILQGAFKDYNGQTYWASINLNSLYCKINPKWLSIAFGYGGEDMISANTRNTLEKGMFHPYRQYYLSLDVDFEKISTENKFLKKIFKVANYIKLPLPTLEINKGFNAEWNWIYF